MSRLIALVLLLAAAVPSRSAAETAGLGLRPMRLEMEVIPGKDKTMSFTIESPPSDIPVRGRLLLTFGDWTLGEDTSVTYHDAGTQPTSASPWLLLSSTDVSVASGQQRLVRVTARVPVGTAPGVYTSAVFVQERPPSQLPIPGEQRFYFRYRYVVTVYVIVSPVSRSGELADAQLITGPTGPQRLSARLTNTGTRHLRPTVSWFVRSGPQEVLALRNLEATVLLPEMSVSEAVSLPTALPPGEYEIEVQVDFHDGRPMQAIQRVLVIGERTE